MKEQTHRIQAFFINLSVQNASFRLQSFSFLADFTEINRNETVIVKPFFMPLVCILNKEKAAVHCLNVGVHNIPRPSSFIILCENETDGCILNKKGSVG